MEGSLRARLRTLNPENLVRNRVARISYEKREIEPASLGRMNYKCGVYGTPFSTLAIGISRQSERLAQTVCQK